MMRRLTRPNLKALSNIARNLVEKSLQDSELQDIVTKPELLILLNLFFNGQARYFRDIQEAFFFLLVA